MNIFIPHRDFRVCAKILDMQRLIRVVQDIKHLTDRIGDRERPKWVGSGIGKLGELWTPLMGSPCLIHLKEYARTLNQRFYEEKGRHLKHFLDLQWIPNWVPEEGWIVWPESLHTNHLAALYRKDPMMYDATLKELGIDTPPTFSHYEYPRPVLKPKDQR